MMKCVNIVLKYLSHFEKKTKDFSFKINKNIHLLYSSTKISIYFLEKNRDYIKSYNLDEKFIVFLQI